MAKIISTFLNPVKLTKAYFFHRKNKKYDKAGSDLELRFYSRILRNDMLHWGYFDDPDIAPENISLQQVEDAQIQYAEKIIEQIVNHNEEILDVGCGMGGLSKLLVEKGYAVEALTPNDNQKNYIAIKQPDLTVHHCIFEDIKTKKKIRYYYQFRIASIH